MTFQPGQSGNPAGRPKGARGKAALFAEGLFEGQTEAIIRKAMSLAMEGDTTALRACLDRVAPRPQGRVVPFELPPLHSAASVLSALADVAAGVSRGDLTPAEAIAVSELLDRYVRTLEHVEVEERLGKLERERAASQGNSNGHGGGSNQANQGDRSAPRDPNDLGPYNFGDAP
jgi:hypothetical protein